MPEDVWEQCCFNITEGGLGLRQHGDVSKCAFVASLVESLPTIERYSPNFSRQLDTSREQSLVVRQFRKALRFINRRSGESFSVTNLDEVKSLLASKRHDETLQGILMAGMSSVRLHAFKTSLEADPHRLAFFISINDGNAGRWLDVCPKSERFSFSDDEFKTLLCYRFFMKQPSFIPGSKCNCKSRPELDPLGHHLATACAKGGFRNGTHTALEYVVKDLLNCAGIMARREETGCFRGADENNNNRPDLSIWNMPQREGKVVADIQVTCPVPVKFRRALSVNQAKKPGRAAELAHRAKVNKYAAIAAANNLEFQSLIFESTGRIHSSCAGFLKAAITKMSQGNEKLNSVFTNFWMSRVVCTLQKGISSAILCRSNLINGNLVRETNYEFSNSFMVEHDIVV